MLIPLRQGELNKLIPAVATGVQFNSALGSPRKILQKVMISSISGVIILLISQSQVTSQFYSIWLVLGVISILYILWSPIYEASRKNSTLRGFNSAAIFEGEISNVFTRELVEKSYEQSNTKGQLELVEDRRRWMFLELEDEDGYLGQLKFPMNNKHQQIKQGLLIRCLALSNRSDFTEVLELSDAWLPEIRQWVGEYPYLLRPAFEEICALRLR